MSHDALDIHKIHIGSGGLIREDEFGIKDIQTFIFHRSHIEIAGRHNHKAL